MAEVDGSVLVRDGKSPDLTPQKYSRAEWLAFIEGVKRGEFDLTGG